MTFAATEIFSFIGLITLVTLAVIGVETLRRALRRTIKETATNQEEAVSGDDPLVDVLHRALANRTGKLRVSDAYLICGIEPGKVNQDQISRFGRAIRELGWERQRRRFDGSLQYAYVKGTTAEREIELVVEYDPHLRSVRIEVHKNVPLPAN
jgi:hypothetical protein